MAEDSRGNVFVSFLGPLNAPVPHGGLDVFAFGSPKNIRALTLPSQPACFAPDSINANGTDVYFADLCSGIGYFNDNDATSRTYPIHQVSTANVSGVDITPNGVVVMPDRSSWFTCYGSYTVAAGTLCLTHTVYMAGWSLWPGRELNVTTGEENAQPVGIMESPGSSSGPFTVRTDKPRFCEIEHAVDHNFVIDGLAAGKCVVTVRDAASKVQYISVTVGAAPAAMSHRRALPRL